MTINRPKNDTDRTEAPIAVVGVGNWLISYDRIGVKVLNMIDGRYGPEVALFNVGSAGLSLLDCINGQRLMLVVDACNAGGTPGDIRVVEMDVTQETAPGPGLHQIGPLEALTVAKHLFPEKLPQRVNFIFVETEGMNDSDLDKAGRRVVSIIDDQVKNSGENCLDAHEYIMNSIC